MMTIRTSSNSRRPVHLQQVLHQLATPKRITIHLRIVSHRPRIQELHLVRTITRPIIPLSLPVTKSILITVICHKQVIRPQPQVPMFLRQQTSMQHPETELGEETRM